MKLLVAELRMGDVEDPEIYAAEPIMAFEKTERGSWLKEHSYEQMSFDLQQHPEVWGYGIRIYAYLNEKDLTFYNLKWSYHGESERSS